MLTLLPWAIVSIVSGNWNDYSYRLTQQPVGSLVEPPAYTMPTVRVTASVSWMETANQREISLSTLKLAPRKIP